MGGAKVVTTFDLGLLVAGYTAMKPAYMHVASQYLGYASNPGNDYDANQAAIGDTGYVLPDYAVGAPVLVATEAWRLTSLGTSGVTLGVYVNPASRHWNAWAAIDANRAPYFLDDSDKTQFSSVIGQGLFIPEPFTMTMLGMGLSSLGMMIRRRRIVERRA